jgi:hypothetical protein
VVIARIGQGLLVSTESRLAVDPSSNPKLRRVLKRSQRIIRLRSHRRPFQILRRNRQPNRVQPLVEAELVMGSETGFLLLLMMNLISDRTVTSSPQTPLPWRQRRLDLVGLSLPNKKIFDQALAHPCPRKLLKRPPPRPPSEKWILQWRRPDCQAARPTLGLRSRRIC